MPRALLGFLALVALALPAVVIAQSPPPVALQPVLGHAVVVEPVSGRVLVQPASRGPFIVLKGARVLAVGSTIKATDGRVRLSVARDRAGHVSRAEFFRGQFEVADQTAKLTTLRLSGSSFRRACGKAQAASRGHGHPVRRLWGDGHGHFQTRGRYSAATVRGTRWLTEDRCDGTLTRVERGVVEVEDFTVPEAPAKTPAPVSGGEGGGQAPSLAPQAAPGRPRIVRVGRGDSYVAAPGGPA